MTASKAKPQEANHGGAAPLQTYLASLLYLRQEAKREGLDAVAEIMWNALTATEEWLNTGNVPAGGREILDSPLCHSLDFLLKWLVLSPARRRQVAQDIARYEAEMRAGEAVPRSLVKG
jgi:hypothetical protein